MQKKQIISKLSEWQPSWLNDVALYEAESRIFLILVARVLGMDYSLKNQMSLVERGYFSELYHQLGICKVADDKIFDLFSQYQKYGNFNWIDSYFVIIKGYHWFDTEDLDEYLTLADEIIADRFELEIGLRLKQL